MAEDRPQALWPEIYSPHHCGAAPRRHVYGDRALPSRAVPGDGAIPVPRILEWILAAGYAGPFEIELIGPRIDAEGRVAAVRRSAQILGEILRSLRPDIDGRSAPVFR